VLNDIPVAVVARLLAGALETRKTLDRLNSGESSYGTPISQRMSPDFRFEVLTGIPVADVARLLGAHGKLAKL
jgi:hypothetical protein